MAAVAALATPAAPSPVASAQPREGARTAAASKDSRAGFDEAMNRAGAAPDRADAGARNPAAEPANKDAAAAAEDKAARADSPADTDKPAPIDEARGLLGWLQQQLAAPVVPISPGPASASAATAAAAPASIPAAGTGSLAAVSDLPAAALASSAAGSGTESTGLAAALPFSLASAARSEGATGPVADGLAAAVSDLLAQAQVPADAARADLTAVTMPVLPPTRLAVDALPLASAAAASAMPAGAPIVLDSPDLPAQLGERLHWLAGNGVQEARLQLHPRDLGSIDVQIRIEARGASVWFAADHAAARGALESSLPQLRERFAADGLQLGQAQVSAQSSAWTFGDSSRQSARAYTPNAASGSGSGANADEDIAAAPARLPVLHVGLVDRYA